MLFRTFLWLLFVGFKQVARMRECLALAPEAIQVDLTAVAQRLGSPQGNCENGLFQESFEAGRAFLAATACPRCVIQTVDLKTFSRLYEGEGKNDRDTPLEMIIERSGNLALFAVTLGQPITDTVAQLFSEHDYLTATLLDAMASLLAEGLVESLEARFARHLAERGGHSTALGYSPGYCGWHVSGQKALFSILKPEKIGVSLGTSCMMRPLKSVSGILVAGGPEVHDFDTIYTCCSGCDTLECRECIARISCPVSSKRELEWTCSKE